MKAFAKINLSLDILSRRDDGYHEVRTVIQSVALGDSISLERVPERLSVQVNKQQSEQLHEQQYKRFPEYLYKQTGSQPGSQFSNQSEREFNERFNEQLRGEAAAGGERFVSNSAFLPGDEKNNAVRAIDLFAECAKLDASEVQTLVVKCFKRIPICGGLGGSSTDAAAALRLMNASLPKERRLPFSELCRLGTTLGADVPFLLRGGTALATGIGNVLERLPPLPRCYVVIIKPPFSGVTAELFAAFDKTAAKGGLKSRPNTNALINELRKQDIKGVARYSYNVFDELLPLPHQRRVSEAKSRLLDNNALCATLSGSGSCVFGLFENVKQAKQAYLSLRKDTECYLTTTIPALPLEDFT